MSFYDGLSSYEVTSKDGTVLSYETMVNNVFLVSADEIIKKLPCTQPYRTWKNLWFWPVKPVNSPTFLIMEMQTFCVKNRIVFYSNEGVSYNSIHEAIEAKDPRLLQSIGFAAQQEIPILAYEVHQYIQQESRLLGKADPFEMAELDL